MAASPNTSSAYGNYEWRHTAIARPYQCTSRHSTRWMRLCLHGRWTASIDDPYPHVQRHLELVPQYSLHSSNFTDASSRAIRLLNTRTVAMIGDSTAQNLWCALVCNFLQQDGTTVDRNVTRGLGGMGMLRLRTTLGHIDFLEPRSIENDAAKAAFGDLKRLASAVQQGSLHKLVVLCNPFGLHTSRSELQGAAYWIFRERSPLRTFQSWADLRLELCHRTRSYCRAGTVATIEKAYLNKALSYATILAQLMEGTGGADSLGILMESMPTHFPEVPGLLKEPREVDMMEDGLDERNSYDRFFVSALLWVHERLRRNTTSAVLKAMQISTPAISSVGPVVGHADPAYIAGFARSEEAAACAVHTSSLVAENCYADALLAHPIAGGKRRSYFRLRDCRPISSISTNGLRGQGWRQRLEAQAANTAGVPLLKRVAHRVRRWDLHPGIKWAKYTQSTALFDCLHSVRSPGSFDGELWELIFALEHRFGAQ